MDHDPDNIERVRCELLKAELTAAFRAPEASYTQLSAADVIARNAADQTESSGKSSGRFRSG